MSRNFGLKAHEIEDDVWANHNIDSSQWVFTTLGLVALGIVAVSLLL